MAANAKVNAHAPTKSASARAHSVTQKGAGQVWPAPFYLLAPENYLHKLFKTIVFVD